MDGPDISALAVLLGGRTGHRRARALWRRFIADPPPGADELAEELGVSVGTIRMDQRAALNDLYRLRRQRVALDAIKDAIGERRGYLGDWYVDDDAG